MSSEPLQIQTGAGAESAALAAIYKNVRKQYWISRFLYWLHLNAAATYHSIICWEECSKYLLVYCRDHLPDSLFKKRYQHTTKFSVASSIYFLSGQLGVVFLLQSAERLDPAIPRLKQKLLALLNKPDAIAESIMKHLSTEGKTEEYVQREKQEWEKTEKLRQRAAYVDLDESLNIVGTPDAIERETAQRWQENARLGIAMTFFLRSPSPSVSSVIKATPKEMRAETESKAKKFVSELKK